VQSAEAISALIKPSTASKHRSQEQTHLTDGVKNDAQVTEPLAAASSGAMM